MKERLRLLWERPPDLVRAAQRPRAGAGGTAAGAATVVVVIFLVLFLLSSSAAATRQRTESKLQRLAEAEQLAAGYAEAERARKQAEAALTAGEFSLLTDLSEKEQAGLEHSLAHPQGRGPARRRAHPRDPTWS